MNENFLEQESIEQTDIEHQALVNAVAAARSNDDPSSSPAAAAALDTAVKQVQIGPSFASSNTTTNSTTFPNNKRLMEKQQQQQSDNRSATPEMSSDEEDATVDQNSQQQQQHHHNSLKTTPEEEGDDEVDGSTSTRRRRSWWCCCCCSTSVPPRIQELYTSPDWWSLWIGLATFSLAFIAVFSVIPYNDDSSHRVPYVIPQPMKWTTNPLDAWDLYNILGTVLLLFVFGLMYLVSCQCMGKLLPNSNGTSATRYYIVGFATMALLATISFWIGSNEWCDKHGLGYAVWAILLGMLVTNITPLGARVDATLAFAAKDGEFFIKCSLVLLAVQLNVLVTVGVPGIAVAWIGSPCAIVLGYIIGTRCIKCEDSLALLTSVGAAWCGASAISAVAPIVGAKSEEVSLAISVVAFFTLAFTFIQPYLAMAVGMDESVAGAWIGASVDQTGNVIVSAAIISEKATEVAAIIKMVLNSGLGVMASVIACWWNSRSVDGEEKKPFSLVMLWDKFPKFTIGFLITSAILTGAMIRLDGTAEGDALPRAVAALNRWWFAIAFVGIGLTTNIRKLWNGAVQSGIIQVYLVANFFDMALALGLAYLLF